MHYEISENVNLAEFPIQLKLPENTKNINFDKYNRIIYFLTPIGILKKYYDTNKLINTSGDYFLYDTSIEGFSIDINLNNLCYFNKTMVILMHLKSRVRKTLFKTNNTIYFMYYNFEFGYKFIFKGKF